VLAVEVYAEGLETSEAEGFSRLLGFELEREDTHSEEIASVDAFERLGNHGLNSLEVRTPKY